MEFHLKKTILFISDHGDPLIPLGSKQAGGQNNYVKQLALHLDAFGYRVDVVTHWSDDTLPAVENFGTNSRVYRFAAGHKGFVDKQQMYTLLPALYDEMVDQLNIEDYDVVHTHYWLSGVLALRLQQHYTFHWLHTNHSLAIAKEEGTGLVDDKRKYFEQLIMERANIVLATTENEREQIEQFTKNITHISVVPIGVSPVYFNDSAEAETFHFPYYFFVGRLEQSKGIFDLLQAFRHMLKTNRLPQHIKLVIAGGCENTVDLTTHTPRHKKLQKAIKGIEHRILFIGPKNEQQLQHLYRNALVTIMPSHYESFGMVAAEAQACGCPVIATKVGGLQNVVKAGITGLHTPKENIQKLSDAMLFMLKHPQQLRMMRHAARRFAKSQFNWRHISKQIKELYNTHDYVSNV